MQTQTEITPENWDAWCAIHNERHNRKNARERVVSTGEIAGIASGKHTLDFEVVGRVYLAFDGEIEIKSENGADIEGEAATIRTAYVKARKSLDTVDVSAWLVKLAARVGAVSLREGGGVYFFPAGSAIETLHKVKAALKGCALHVVEEIPAARSEEAIGAVVNALATEIAAEITAIENELTDSDMSERVAGNRIDQVDAFTAKVKSYGTLLGDAASSRIADLTAKLKTIRERLNTKASRTNQLEVD